MVNRSFHVVAMLALAGTLAQGAEVMRKIHVSGDARFHAIAVDPEARRIYLVRNASVLVLDADTEKTIATLSVGVGARGIVLAHDVDRIYVATEKMVSIYGMKKLNNLGQITENLGKNPGAIVFDTPTHRFFVANQGSENVSVLDGDDGEVEGTVAMNGRVRGVAVDNQGKAFASVEDTNELVEMDVKAMTVTHRFSTAPCSAPGSLTYDGKANRIFAACGNHMIAVMDSAGNVTSTIPSGLNIGSIDFDAASGTLLAASGEGVLNVYTEQTPGHFVAERSVRTAEGARAGAFDKNTGNLILPAQTSGAEPDQAGLLVIKVR